MSQQIEGLTKKQFNDAVHLLLELGYRVVVLNGDIIRYDEFEPSDKDNIHIKIKGSIINSVLIKYMNLLNNSVRETLLSSAKSQYDPLLQEIDRQPIYEYNYHCDFKWIMYYKR